MNSAKCAGCSRPFAATGWGQQSVAHPRLCSDCAIREVSAHGYHAPGVKCLNEFIATKKEATHGRAS